MLSSETNSQDFFAFFVRLLNNFTNVFKIVDDANIGLNHQNNQNDNFSNQNNSQNNSGSEDNNKIGQKSTQYLINEHVLYRYKSNDSIYSNWLRAGIIVLILSVITSIFSYDSDGMTMFSISLLIFIYYAIHIKRQIEPLKDEVPLRKYNTMFDLRGKDRFQIEMFAASIIAMLFSIFTPLSVYVYIFMIFRYFYIRIKNMNPATPFIFIIKILTKVHSIVGKVFNLLLSQQDDETEFQQEIAYIIVIILLSLFYVVALSFAN